MLSHVYESAHSNTLNRRPTRQRYFTPRAATTLEDSSALQSEITKSNSGKCCLSGFFSSMPRDAISRLWQCRPPSTPLHHSMWTSQQQLVGCLASDMPVFRAVAALLVLVVVCGFKLQNVSIRCQSPDRQTTDDYFSGDKDRQATRGRFVY